MSKKPDSLAPPAPVGEVRKALASFGFPAERVDSALRELGYESTPPEFELFDLYCMAGALRENARQTHHGELPRGVSKRIFLWCAELWARQLNRPGYGEHEFKNAFYAWEKRGRPSMPTKAEAAAQADVDALKKRTRRLAK